MEQLINSQILSIISAFIALFAVWVAYRNMRMNYENLNRQYKKSITSAWITDFRKEIVNFITHARKYQYDMAFLGQANTTELQTSAAMLRLFLNTESNLENRVFLAINDLVDKSATGNEINDLLDLSYALIEEKQRDVLEYYKPKLNLWNRYQYRKAIRVGYPIDKTPNS
jgi:hypothetical protein